MLVQYRICFFKFFLEIPGGVFEANAIHTLRRSHRKTKITNVLGTGVAGFLAPPLAKESCCSSQNYFSHFELS